MFELFDPEYEVRKTAGQLPHWYQPGVTYFITFRTDDSVPAVVAEEWYQHRNEWLNAKGIDPRDTNWRSRLEQLPEQDRRAFHITLSDQFMTYLDRGCGKCVLKRPELARIVADSFHFFDGQRYILGDYVVMPNHVHLLLCLIDDTDLTAQCFSWKKFTATAVNRMLGRKGRFWHEESFDHLVRSPDQFEAIRTYIADNPRKAELLGGEYFHWVRPG